MAIGLSHAYAGLNQVLLLLAVLVLPDRVSVPSPAKNRVISAGGKNKVVKCAHLIVPYQYLGCFAIMASHSMCVYLTQCFLGCQGTRLLVSEIYLRERMEVSGSYINQHLKRMKTLLEHDTSMHSPNL